MANGTFLGWVSPIYTFALNLPSKPSAHYAVSTFPVLSRQHSRTVRSSDSVFIFPLTSKIVNYLEAPNLNARTTHFVIDDPRQRPRRRKIEGTLHGPTKQFRAVMFCLKNEARTGGLYATVRLPIVKRIRHGATECSMATILLMLVG
jgi:hypothetical protein